MHHAGGYDHSRDHRIRRCDGCTHRLTWSELREIFDPSTDKWGYWVCIPCLDRLPNARLVPRRPDWRENPNNVLAIMAKKIREGG